MPITAQAVEYLGDYRLHLTFNSGEKGVADLAELLHSAPNAAPLRDTEEFLRVFRRQWRKTACRHIKIVEKSNLMEISNMVLDIKRNAISKFFRFVWVVAIVIHMGSSKDLYAGGLTVDNAVWTHNVSRETKQYTDIISDSVKQETPETYVYLWTIMSGDSEVYKWLLREKKMPIRHRWLRSVGMTEQTGSVEMPEDDIISDDGILIGVRNNDEAIKRIRFELEQNGAFEWRMWSRKKFLPPGQWTVQILYADRTKVMCNNAPCEYSIRVAE